MELIIGHQLDIFHFEIRRVLTSLSQKPCISQYMNTTIGYTATIQMIPISRLTDHSKSQGNKKMAPQSDNINGSDKKFGVPDKSHERFRKRKKGSI